MPRRRFLIDGTNVVGSRPDGWWRDRPAAFARLVDELAVLAATGAAVTVVFDGRPAPGLAEGTHQGVEVRWARRQGRDAADDRVVELVAEASDPEGLAVVTSDRGLRARLERWPVSVLGAGSFRRELAGR